VKAKKFNSESEAQREALRITGLNPTLTQIDSGTYKGQYDCLIILSLVTGNVIWTGYWI
jgi:hypothetical protein